MDFILYLIIGIFAPGASSEKRNITIGFLLNGDKRLEGIAREELDYLSHESSDLKFDFIGTELGKEAIDSTQNICDTLLGNRSYVIITAHPINSTTSIDLISYICAFYKIPVVGLESRKAELSDKNNHASFLRVVPTYTDQAHLWSSLVKHFKWNKVNLVTSDDYSNRLTYIQFTSWAYKEGVMIENSVLFPSEKKNLTSYLSPLATSQSKVIVLAASLEDSIEVYKAAKELGVIGKGHIWLVAEQSMGGIAKQHVPQGAIGLRILHYPLKNYLKDAIRVVTKAIQFLSDQNMLLTEPPGSCDEPGGFWKTGSMLFNVLANTSIHGSTGKVAFNWHGDRTNAKYEVINIRHDRSLLRVGLVVEDELIINQSQIVWPGNETQVPNGIYISNHLKIVTVESQPFVIAKDMHPSGNCSNYNTGKDEKKMNVLCTGHSTKLHKTGDHCCSGFCIDLLNRLKNDLNFTYELYIVEDGNFGSLNRVNGTSIKRWNGMVGDIVEGKADLIVASLTINNERAQYIEFSKPFKYQGITILIKKEEEKDDLVSFLRPFKTELWLLVLLSVHVVAVILYLLDRFSPFGRYRLSQTEKEETALDLSSAMWFSWGVLLNSGIGEGTPRSFSARVLGMVWAGFAMIIVASYTANLAAFLVLDRPQPKVSGIDDPELRNPSNKFKYGTVKDSSVDAYFRRQVELSSMYTFMEEHNVATDEIGIEKVKDGSLGAFIWDSPVLFHETSKDCNLLTVGELFGRSGYGIGMPKGSPWSNKISLAILHFHESGVMEDLESTWISFGSCENNVNQPTTLGLTHMLGVFIMVAVGIGAGIVIVILEVLYYKHKGWRKNQQKVLRQTTEHWQERVMETRRSKILQQQNNNNGHVTNGVANGRLEEANENEESGFDNAGYHPSSNNLQEHAT